MKNLDGDAPLHRASLSLRVLYTGYLLVIGLGLLTSFGQILMTHGMADGSFGLSVDDIVYSYYGNRGNSRLEEKLRGTMKDKADSQDRASIVKWVRSGAVETEWKSSIQAVFHKNCIKCHGAIPNLADFRTFEKVKPMADFDEGATFSSLTRVSHIHLFGIAFIFFFVCLIFNGTTGIPSLIKTAAIAMPFAFLFIDVMSWWLTKLSPSFAYLTILAGFGYALASGFMITTSLYQMWILPRRKQDAAP